MRTQNVLGIVIICSAWKQFALKASNTAICSLMVFELWISTGSEDTTLLRSHICRQAWVHTHLHTRPVESVLNCRSWLNVPVRFLFCLVLKTTQKWKCVYVFDKCIGVWQKILLRGLPVLMQRTRFVIYSCLTLTRASDQASFYWSSLSSVCRYHLLPYRKALSCKVEVGKLREINVG